MLVKPFYYQETNGIRITVRPRYLIDQSQPQRATYVFAYFVRIENIGRHTVQLISRRWLIRDSIGEQHEVAGDGVVGEQPVLAPGAVHEYHSFCILKSPNGSMEGAYHFTSRETSPFDAAIPRFILTTDEASWPPV
ncbi:MAG TPA: Co2+/Mg2+ efflux protein ApaG [Herpetosiphonaceae bacterium]